MSSNILKNSNNDNINEDKNNSINTFSQNFNKCLINIKHSKKLDNEKTDSWNNLTNKNNNNTQLNSLKEFEFLYNDSINKKNSNGCNNNYYIPSLEKNESVNNSSIFNLHFKDQKLFDNYELCWNLKNDYSKDIDISLLY